LSLKLYGRFMIAPERIAGKGFLRGKYAAKPSKGMRVGVQSATVNAPKDATFLPGGITDSLNGSYCGPISAKHAPSWLAR
jgi:hypothetical protein